MDKIISLKLQLAEAAKYIRSESPTQQRLAVILLDNFVELQLAAQLKVKHMYDNILPRSKRRFTVKEKRAIFSNHNKLLEMSTKEGIITKQDSTLLAFCHEVRNVNYHKGSDEDILTKVSVIILHDVIMEYQPKWQHGFHISRQTMNDEKDPFTVENKEGGIFSHKQQWQAFLEKYFLCDLVKSTPISQLISDFLLNKLYQAKDAFTFVEQEKYSNYFTGREWSFDQLLFHYAFKREEEETIEEAYELDNKDIMRLRLKEFSSKWTAKTVIRIDQLIKLAHSIAKQDSYDGFEKFRSCHKEVLLIYHALSDAAADLSEAIESQSDF